MTNEQNAPAYEGLAYRAVGIVVLPAFPLVALIAWLLDDDVTAAGCVSMVWNEWHNEFWRIA